MRALSVLGLALIGVTALPGGAVWALEASRSPDSLQLIARGGGGGGRGGGGGGGGARMGGGGGGGGGARVGGGGGGHTGFANAGSSGLNRGDARPSGGWSNQVRSPGGANPSINRPSGGNAGHSRPGGGLGSQTPVNRPSTLPANRPAGGGVGERPPVNRPAGGGNLNGGLNATGNRNLNGNVNRSGNLNANVNRSANINRNTTVNRNWNRNVNVNNVNVRPGWARPGWGAARPWNTGWYGGWASPTWGWWGARAAVWGIGTLATAAVINSAVNSAISANQTYILVPNTSYQLLFGSVQPSGTSAVSFAVTADGSTYQLSADCNAGLIDGQEPQNAAEAELLNAACQVAFGSV